jgi:hypothetical protein
MLEPASLSVANSTVIGHHKLSLVALVVFVDLDVGTNCTPARAKRRNP